MSSDTKNTPENENLLLEILLNEANKDAEKCIRFSSPLLLETKKKRLSFVTTPTLKVDINEEEEYLNKCQKFTSQAIDVILNNMIYSKSKGNDYLLGGGIGEQDIIHLKHILCHEDRELGMIAASLLIHASKCEDWFQFKQLCRNIEKSKKFFQAPRC